MKRIDLPPRPIAAPPLIRTTPAPRPRVRPGDFASYVSLRLGPGDEEILRMRAARLEMSVDALVAIVVELLAAQRLLLDLGVSADAADDTQAQTIGGSPKALPPTGPLRDWVTSLEQGSGPGPGPAAATDELPQILLPDRLEPRLRQLDHATIVAAAGGAALGLARRYDAEAAREGLTLTEWVLANALAARRPPSSRGGDAAPPEARAAPQ
jgi:hypothetical protein